FCLSAGKGRSVHAECHAYGRLFDGLRGQRLGRLRIGQGIANGHVGDTGQGDDVAHRGAVDGNAGKPFVGIDGDDLEWAGFFAETVDTDDDVAGAHGAATSAANGTPALVAVVVERGDLHLERCARVT